MKKKIGGSGQAALEFLSTYGFVFLIIIVIVGALSYIGVFTPDKYLPNRCTPPTGFTCSETKMQADVPSLAQARLTVIVTNRLSNAVVVSLATATSQYGDSVAADPCSVSPPAIDAGSQAMIVCNLTGGPGGLGSAAFPAKGKKIKIFLNLQYTERGNVYPVSGTIEAFNMLT